MVEGCNLGKKETVSELEKKTRNVRHTESRSRNHFCRGKQSVSNIMSGFLRLYLYSMQSAFRGTILSTVTYLGLSYFSTLAHKQRHIRTEVNKHKIFVLIFSKSLFGTFPLTRRIQRYIIINVSMSSCEETVILVEFLKETVLSRQLLSSEIFKYKIS